jgi:hypothetical protein
VSRIKAELIYLGGPMAIGIAKAFLSIIVFILLFMSQISTIFSADCPIIHIEPITHTNG